MCGAARPCTLFSRPSRVRSNLCSRRPWHHRKNKLMKLLVFSRKPRYFLHRTHDLHGCPVFPCHARVSPRQFLSSGREQITVGLRVQQVPFSAGWVMPAFVPPGDDWVAWANVAREPSAVEADQPRCLFHPQFDNILRSIASTECGEIPSSTNPGISGDDTVSICISST